MFIRFLPQELVDLIYLYTDFYTAIRHIPTNKYVLKVLFERDVCRTSRMCGNANSNTIRKILRMKCEQALVYFKHSRPYSKIRYDVFKYDENGQIDINSESNNMLIRVYNFKEEILRKYTKAKRLMIRPWVWLP